MNPITNSLRYVGPLAHLRGKTALVMKKEPTDSVVFAQFDDVALTLSGAPVETEVLDYEPHARFQTMQPLQAPPRDALGYRWHPFPAEHFEAPDA